MLVQEIIVIIKYLIDLALIITMTISTNVQKNSHKEIMYY